MYPQLSSRSLKRLVVRRPYCSAGAVGKKGDGTTCRAALFNHIDAKLLGLNDFVPEDRLLRPIPVGLMTHSSKAISTVAVAGAHVRCDIVSHYGDRAPDPRNIRRVRATTLDRRAYGYGPNINFLEHFQ